jgi:hypothetical protein
VARARDLVVTTDRFELHASAYVELHTWLWDLALRPKGAMAEDATTPFAEEVEQYRGAISCASPPRALDDAAIERLRRCVDDRCALGALLGTPLAKPFARAFPEYVSSTWNTHAQAARAAIERATPLLEHENGTLDAFAKDVALELPEGRIRIDVVGHPETERASRGIVAASGACFSGDGILECALFAAAMQHAQRSKLARAIRDAAPRHHEAAWSALVAHAIALRVQKTTGRPSRLARVLLESEPRLARWLAREWPKLGAGEDPVDFAKRLAGDLDPAD